MPLLFVENDDSFSWNLIDLLPFAREAISVQPGLAVAGDPTRLEGMDAVVIGPGPTDPARAGIVGIVAEAARRGLPLLGVCLGHQAIGLAFGARLVRTQPCHGQPHCITFERSRLFPGCSGAHEVMRYHSLALTDLPAPLRVVAATADGIVMALEHERLPIAGLQFHPDSYASPTGRAIVAEFFKGTLGPRR
ncbi:MAG: aminodeoxychorismate/anthranilate synthase component II [Proteobacteria bacterium]|nr:aminodeoxychorismate/anthranilate synthase component II [Pseudomonadota bacterium]